METGTSVENGATPGSAQGTQQEPPKARRVRKPRTPRMKKVRKPRVSGPFAVGNWKTYPGDVAVFEPLPLTEQPAPAITTRQDMIAWIRKKFGNAPGRYEFVQTFPGAVVVSRRTDCSVRVDEGNAGVSGTAEVA